MSNEKNDKSKTNDKDAKKDQRRQDELELSFEEQLRLLREHYREGDK